MLPYSEEEMSLKWVFQHNDPKHTSKQQHLVSRPTRLNGQTWTWKRTGGVTSKMLFLGKTKRCRGLVDGSPAAVDWMPVHRWQRLVDSMNADVKQMWSSYNSGSTTKYQFSDSQERSICRHFSVYTVDVWVWKEICRQFFEQSNIHFFPFSIDS